MDAGAFLDQLRAAKVEGRPVIDVVRGVEDAKVTTLVEPGPGVVGVQRILQATIFPSSETVHHTPMGMLFMRTPVAHRRIGQRPPNCRAPAADGALGHSMITKSQVFCDRKYAEGQTTASLEILGLSLPCHALIPWKRIVS